MTEYKPLTPYLREKIRTSMNDSIAELKACNSPITNIQAKGLEMAQKYIMGLPNGFPIPFKGDLK